MTAVDSPPPPPPPASPREITATARRSAWLDPRVRFWWTAASVIAVIAVYLLVAQAWRWRQEANLIRYGAVVEATVDEAAGQTITGRPQPPDSRVTLGFELNGREHQVRGHLAGRTEFIVTGQTVTIRVDREDPDRWTYRDEPTPLVRHLVGGLLLVPVVASLLFAAWLLHRRLLKIWQSGEAVEAEVVETRQSPIAPLSHVVRCAARSGGDRRVISVFMPRRLGNPQPGDVMWLIAQPGRLDRAVPALMYREEEVRS